MKRIRFPMLIVIFVMVLSLFVSYKPAKAWFWDTKGTYTATIAPYTYGLYFKITSATLIGGGITYQPTKTTCSVWTSNCKVTFYAPLKVPYSLKIIATYQAIGNTVQKSWSIPAKNPTIVGASTFNLGTFTLPQN